jgi:phosphatidylserine decarboxylase
LDADDGLPDSSVSATPVLSITGDKGQELQLDHFDFSGPNHVDPKSNEYPTEHVQEPLHAVAAGATPENSDSWSDDAEGDLLSTGPSPNSTPSPGTSVGQKKMGRFSRTNKAKGESSSDVRLLKMLLILLNASSTSRISLSVIARDSTPKLRSILVPI